MCDLNEEEVKIIFSTWVRKGWEEGIDKYVEAIKKHKWEENSTDG